MQKFVAGQDILSAIKAAFEDAERADLAVAYWGLDAVKRLGVGGIAGPVRILCDAWSGACNPEELERILKLETDVELRTLRGLHTKVYLTPDCVIVGSSNASANGLGEEGEEAGNSEAAIQTSDPALVAASRAWFEEKWKLTDTTPVTTNDLPALRLLWKARRQSRPLDRMAGRTLLEALRNNPEFFRDRPIRVVAYENGTVSPIAEKKFRQLAPTAYTKHQLEKYKNSIPYYEDDGTWDVSPGEYILDFGYSRKAKKVSSAGFWRVRAEDPFHRFGSEGRIILCDRVHTFGGLKLTKSDQDEIGKQISLYLLASGIVPDEDGNLLDMKLDELGLQLRKVAPAGVRASDPWLQKLSPAARERIIAFAGNQKPKAREIWVGTVGSGRVPNFRLVFPDGSKIDYDGQTYDSESKTFRARSKPIRNDRNITRLD